jgi:hypothetical protein
MRSDEGLATVPKHPHPRIELVCAEFSTIYPMAGESVPVHLKDTLMSQDNRSPDVIEAEKRTNQAANANSADGGQCRPDKPAQPMAHPPEDTFVGVGTHPRPEKTGG